MAEYASALAVCVGLITFTTAEWTLSPLFHPVGIILVSLSVVADSILPNVQEQIFSKGSSRLEVTLYTNWFTLLSMTAITSYSGDLLGMIRYGAENHILIMYMTIYTFVAYIAISMFMQVVKGYGGVVAVFLGTIRKALSLILSFLIFPKQFSWMYVIGAALVLGGLMTSSILKQKQGESKRSNSAIDMIDMEKQNERIR